MINALLTESQMARRLQITVRTARNWRRRGTGPPYLVASETRGKKTIRYDALELATWLRGKRRG